MIVDASMYFNEKELIELRVKYLDDLIDCFVIIEADVTHQGKKKKWNFPEVLKNNLKEFSHKIQYHQIKIDVEKAESEKDPRYKGNYGRSWRIENVQRNFIRNACQKFSQDDIIIISDADEIVSKEKISFVKSCDFKTVAPIAFEQALFHLNCNFLNLERWVGSVVTTKELIDKYEPQSFRNHRDRISSFNKAGWSFSSFGGSNRVREKFEAFAHEEYNNEKFKSETHIKNCLEKGSDLFHRNIKKKKIDNNFFPKDLLKLMELNSTFYFGPKTTL